MGVVLMDVEAAAGLVASYLDASHEVTRRAALLAGAVSRATGVGAPVGSVVSDLRRLAADLAEDAADVNWRRLWLIERDSFRIGTRRLAWLPSRPLRSLPTTDLLERIEDPDSLIELAARSLSDPELAGAAAERLGYDGMERLMLDGIGSGSEAALAILLARASRAEAGLAPGVLDFLLPSNSKHAARRIALFGRLLGGAHFSEQVTSAAAVWATNPAHRPHIGLAMRKYQTNFASAALGAVAATGVSAALFLTSSDGPGSLGAIRSPEAAFEISVDGDEATAALLEAVTAAAIDGTLTPEQSFDVWLTMREHLESSSLPGARSRLALAELTNLHWDEVRFLSTSSTIPLFAEIAADDVALATVSVELGARSVPLIAEAAADMYAGREIAAQVEILASGYEHVFEGIHQSHGGPSAGGLVASALDTAISAATVPAGPAVAWVAQSVSRELVDRAILAEHPRSIATPRELFEHEFSPSNTAVPGGNYPAVSAFELQVLKQVLDVDPGLAEKINRGLWFDGAAVLPPDLPSESFAKWFAKTTSGRSEVARSYQALKSEFSDKVLLEALKVESE